jgi:hypothetical protein
MIHRESNQLIIGPYFIDDKGNVRAADVKNNLIGRMTATARHLTDPANKVYFYDMEGPLYEVDVHTLKATRLFVKPVAGWHGKGAYTGQGVLVVANNGEVPGGGIEKLPFELPTSKWQKGPEDAGVLAEFDGQTWRTISRRQHTDVTSPGGIYGAANASDPIWSIGWDKRSVLLDVRDAADKTWHTFRLPKASHTYDPKHGWYTEWPRIREIVPAQNGQPARLMMTMHGMMFDFPKNFSLAHCSGLRPIASHLRYIPDFCHWNGRVVLAADDTSIMQNPLAGISQSNLWFGTPDQLADFGPAAGWGAVWQSDPIKANEPSDSYLLAGFPQRVLHLAQDSDQEVIFTVKIDELGDQNFKPYTTLKVPAHGYVFHIIPPEVKGEWIQLSADKNTTATAVFHYNTPSKFHAGKPDKIFASLAPIAANEPVTPAILRPGQDKLLHFATQHDGKEIYFQVGENLTFHKTENPPKVAAIHKANDLKPDFTVDDASVIVTTKTGRFRLPKSAAPFDPSASTMRSVREVASERFLANIHGTFYETPRGTDGKPDWQNAKPIASHTLAITDFCSWRGLLVLSGTRPTAKPDGHFFQDPASSAGLWFGALDDLWKLGKPTGVGGPWKNTPVEPNIPSDLYLMTNYDQKSLTLSHDSAQTVTFKIEVDFTNTGDWHTYQEVTVPPGQAVTHQFPTGFGAYWARLSPSHSCRATATFRYK